MRKHLKSVASAVMAVLMMVSLFCTSAMAAEQEAEANNVAHIASVSAGSTIKSEGGINPTSDWPWWNLVDVIARFSGNPTLVNQPMLLGSVYCARTVQGVVAEMSCHGPSTAKVNFSFRNMSSGKTWTFSADANGTSYVTYSSYMPAGNYEIWVNSVTYQGAYSMMLRFASPK